MSLSAAASLRPLRRQCLRRHHPAPAPYHALLSLRTQPRTTNLCLLLRAAAIAVAPPPGPHQRRFQSNSSDGQKQNEDESSNDGGKQQQQQQQQQSGAKPTFRQFMGRSLIASLRNLAYAMSPKGMRQGMKESPVLTSSIMGLLFATIIFCGIQVTLFYRTFYNPEFARYPEPVRTTLRRAVYNTVVQQEPELALKYYNRAMLEAAAFGLDPYSDEVLGIRVMVSFWLEKISNYKQAADVLESVLRDCVAWVREAERQAAEEGNVDARGRLIRETPKLEAPRPRWTPRPDEFPEPETIWARRERLLSRAVRVSVKLGELYADEHVLEADKSHAHLVWAVETTLKEFRRRREEAPRPGEDAWLTPTEVGAQMESLGRDYERKSQFHLAIPLFFQALRNCDLPCHRAVVMNNLAACFAQHPIYSPADGGASSFSFPETETASLTDLFASSMPNTRRDCLEAAANWARNAYQHGRDVKGDDRTPECDQACAVALCNWGDVAALQGDKALARRKFEQAIELSGRIEYQAGVKQAQEGIRRLNAPPEEKKPKGKPFRS